MFLDRIFKTEKPANHPVEEQSKMELFILRLKRGVARQLSVPMKSAPIPKQIGMQSEQIGNPRSRSEATLGFCS